MVHPYSMYHQSWTPILLSILIYWKLSRDVQSDEHSPSGICYTLNALLLLLWTHKAMTSDNSLLAHVRLSTILLIITLGTFLNFISNISGHAYKDKWKTIQHPCHFFMLKIAEVWLIFCVSCQVSRRYIHQHFLASWNSPLVHRRFFLPFFICFSWYYNS